MTAVLSATVPIFLIIAIGYLVVRMGVVPKDGVKVLGAFVLNIAMPALVFRAVVQRPLAEVMNPTFILAAAGSALLCGGVVAGLAWIGLGRTAVAGVTRGMGAGFANSAYIGYPIAMLVLGPGAGLALALMMVAENLLILPIALAIADAAAAAGRPAREILRSTASGLVRNPLMLAILAGVAVLVSGLTVAPPLMTAIDLLANASTALALAAIGGALVGIRPHGMIGDIALTVAGKLILHPLLVVAVLGLLPPLPDDLRKALVIIAAAPMMSIYPIFAARYGEGEVAAASALVATILSFLTMSATIALI